MKALALALALALDDKVLALALALVPQVLALALREKSWPWPWPWQGQEFFPKMQATWLLYVYALLQLLELEAKRDLSKSGPPSTSNFECQICHRMCRSRIGLLAHNKSHS